MPDDPQLQSIVQRMVEAGESEEDIALVIRHYQPQKPEKPKSRGYVGTGPGGYAVVDDPAGYARETNDALAEQAPTIGAMLATGGVSGVLRGAGAAMLGGSAGKAVQHGARGESPINADVPLEGLKQGAYELGGRGVGEALKFGGRALYRTALGPSKALTKDFGDLAETGIDAGAIPGTKSAVAKVDAARRASSAEARGMLAGTLPPGARIKTDVPLRGLDELKARVKANPTANKDLAAIEAFANDVRASHPDGFTPDELLDFKQAGQGKASQHYRAAQTGDIAGQMDADANAAVAGGAQRFLERLAPNTAKANARTKSLIGLERALEDAAVRPNKAAAWMAVPSLGTSLLSIPQVGGTAGIAASRAGGVLNRGQLPNVARVLEMLARQEMVNRLGETEQEP